MRHPETYFRLAWCAVPKEKSAFLKHVSNSVQTLSLWRVDNNMYFKLIAFEVALHLLLKTNKQTNKMLDIGFGLFAQNYLCFRTLHNMRIRL